MHNQDDSITDMITRGNDDMDRSSDNPALVSCLAGNACLVADRRLSLKLNPVGSDFLIGVDIDPPAQLNFLSTHAPLARLASPTRYPSSSFDLVIDSWDQNGRHRRSGHSYALSGLGRIH